MLVSFCLPLNVLAEPSLGKFVTLQPVRGENMSNKLSVFEQQTYDYVKEHGEMIVTNVPKNLMGTIPHLKNLGLLETFRKPATQWASQKKTFVKALPQE